ncbi:beta-eliminating lyase-related protein [Nocardioides koreensis]|uniref:Beta-eliminating lyase-related protein n=1 Tax=Nocardioides koreensis TaxID=433651 RepID=A0ABN2ZL58_9ACTN
MTDLDERLRDAVRACTDMVVWHRRTTPGEVFSSLASACEELGIEDWDRYGDGGAVARVEEQVAEVLGKPAAVFFVSGTMAQQAMLRVWCDRRGSSRVALPDLSHLLFHELDGPRLLHGLRFEPLTEGRHTPTADDLRALPAGLGAALVELPLRDAGCLLPEWDDLAALAGAARDLGVPLHADGARIWESQPFYDRPLPEIAGLFDSMYVSFYKGLGAPAGAAVVGEQDAMDELRGWRQRMGGQLHQLTPYAVPALLGLRDRLPRMGEYVAWARALAGELVAAGLRVNPSPPHINTFEVFADAPLHDVEERLAALMEREKVQPCGSWRETTVPGVSTTEVSCYDSALAFDPAKVAAWYAEIAGL